MDFTKVKKFTSSNQKGSIGVWIILALVIIGSIYFVDGIFPGLEHIDIGEEDRVVIIDKEVTEATGAAENALRLRTVTFKECAETIAVNLLIDTSGSMGNGTPSKLSELKKALKSFSEKLTETSVIGLQEYSVQFNPLIGPKLFDDATKNEFLNTIDSLQPQTATHTRTAMQSTVPILERAKQQFPNHQFALIFFSDGIPESEVDLRNDSCKKKCPIPGTNNERCYAISQDPISPTNIGKEIQDMGVRVYSITVLEEGDACFNTELSNLMQSVASPDSYRATFDQTELTQIYNEITFSLCGKVE